MAEPVRIGEAPARASAGGVDVDSGFQMPKLLQRPKDSHEVEEAPEPEAPKTMQQKEAEYAAARARIFGTKGNGGRGPKGQGRGAAPSRGRGGYAEGRSGGGQSGGYGGGGGGYGGGQSGGYGGGHAVSSGAGRSARSGAGGGGRRQRGEEASDPDYDRNIQHFAPRLAPPEEQPFYNNSRLVGPPGYAEEFPSLGGR